MTHPSLQQCLERLGPARTPWEATQWERSFPLDTDSLTFVAVLEREGDWLRALVHQHYQSIQGQASPQPILECVWKASKGAWCFDRAALDGKPLAEQAAIAAFQDYLNALAVDPQSSASPKARIRA